ncbi:MAG: hypothetical protein ACKPKO_42580, partial [Candidatus Fonsibacter sp.]
MGTCPNNKKRPPTIPKSNLAEIDISPAEIDISKAYTGAFMRIKSIPVFKEFDTWQSDQEHEPLFCGGELLRPLIQKEIQLVLRLLSEATEATPRNKS